MNQSPKRVSSKARRTLKYESLERRELFAADIFHGAFHGSNSHHYESGHVASPSIASTSTSNGSNSELRSNSVVRLAQKLSLRLKGEIGNKHREGSTANHLSCNLSGNTIATLVTDSRGKASLKIAATPAVAAAMTGDVVAVSGIGSGTLSLHGSSQSHNSLGSSKLSASLTGVGTGKAEFETKGTKQSSKSKCAD